MTATARGRLRLPEHVVLSLLLLALTGALVYSEVLWRWDQVIYDAHLRLWSRPAAADIVIVAVDEDSLSELGRWPWPRRVHARLLEEVTRAGARVVGFDVVFSEPDRADPQGDQMLAQAIAENGHVILPILNEQQRVGGQLIETLPLPSLTAAAAGLGHVEVELDSDGVARSVYLRAGLGAPHWDNISLALLRELDAGPWQQLPGARNPAPAEAAPFVWVRDYEIRIPFAGPPGHFQSLSYAQVLRGDYPADSFRDRIVLIGATATGLGDILPTPVSGRSSAMPGVEVVANVIDSLRRGLSIAPLGMPGRLILSLLLVALPIPLFTGRTPRGALVVTLGLLLLGGVSVVVLSLGLRLWFPPTAALLGIALSYPLWSWRRLEHTVRYLNSELSRLAAEPAALRIHPDADIPQLTGFVARLLPLQAWASYSAAGTRLMQSGQAPPSLPRLPPLQQARAWQAFGEPGWWWLRQSDERVLGICWERDTPPDAAETDILFDLADSLDSAPPQHPRSRLELIERRIEQVQAATERLGYMRRFISGSLAQMEEGVLVASNTGQVLLANSRAAVCLGLASDVELNGRMLPDLMAGLEFQDGESLDELLARVLLQHQSLQVAARYPHGRDLLLQLAPAQLDTVGINGIIFNLADITPLRASERKRAELLSFISHDLRSPLVSILALTALARRKPQEPSPELPERIDRYARRTLELAEDFVQLSRAESGETLDFRELDLVTLALNAMEEVWSQAQARGTRLERQFSVQEAWIHGDTSLLQRSLVNLLTNAIKYSPENALVTVSLEQQPEALLLCVRDTGHGIAEEDIPRLFDRYARIHREEHAGQGGAGLGLAFVRAAVERHGGEVSVQSRRGEGACFCIQLPTATAEHD